MSHYWTHQKERSNIYLIRFICNFASKSGRRFVRFFLPVITLYFFLTSPLTRRSSRHFQRRAGVQKINSWTVLRHMHWFSSIVLDRVYFITDQFQYFDIKLKNLEVIDKVLSEHKKCILLGSHLGSFDVLRTMAVSQDKIPLKILMHRSHNEMITGVLEGLNPDLANTVIDLADEDAILEVQQSVDEGYSIGILGDRHAGKERVVSANLLGGEVEMPAGPFLLASIFKVPIVVFYGLYRGGNRYEIVFELLSEHIDISRENREQDLQDICQKYCQSLERHIAIEPKNWFNFYDYWRDDQ